MIWRISRLTLQHLRHEDIPLLHKYIFADPLVMHYTFGGTVFSLSETEAFIERYFAKSDEKIGLAPLFVREESRLIGFAGLLPCESVGSETYELGFVLSPTYWGKGYATEIGLAQVELAHVLGLKEVYALVNPENNASKAVLKKLEMVYLERKQLPERGYREIYRRKIV